MDTQRLGVVAKVPLSAIMNVWINASVTAKYSDDRLGSRHAEERGRTRCCLHQQQHQSVGRRLDSVRPKWGLFRNKAAGAGEAAIHYNDMKIIRGAVGSAPA